MPLILALAAVFATGCDSGESRTTTKLTIGDSTTFTYEFSERGCSTGKHALESLEDYCSTLTSRSANQSCALEPRREEWLEHCTSGFVETP
jgi:hypothetical protein